jgi:hypothetical protein
MAGRAQWGLWHSSAIDEARCGAVAIVMFGMQAAQNARETLKGGKVGISSFGSEIVLTAGLLDN